MNKILNKALASVATLSESDQEKIALELLDHVRKLKGLRAEIDKGLRALDAGKGKELDVEDLIIRARRRHGGG